jgi:hypothetical protein
MPYLVVTRLRSSSGPAVSFDDGKPFAYRLTTGKDRKMSQHESIKTAAKTFESVCNDKENADRSVGELIAIAIARATAANELGAVEVLKSWIGKIR